MASFDRSGSDLHVSFEPEEASILKQLLRDLEDVLAEGPGDDPIRARLYPDAYETPEEQGAYEELVGDQLQGQKLRIVREARGSLTADKVHLDAESIQSWLVVLTDLRLAIGTRLNVTEETMARELDPALAAQGRENPKAKN